MSPVLLRPDTGRTSRKNQSPDVGVSRYVNRILLVCKLAELELQALHRSGWT